jgi:hypothetical protein
MKQTSSDADSNSKTGDATQADALTELLGQWLREQPSLRAPDTLQGQVMAAIERHERRRQQGFSHWPVMARAAFIVLASVVAKIAVDLSMPLWGELGTLQVPRMPLGTAMLQAILAVTEHLPHWWLYGGIALLVMIYGGLFGIGTAVYRTLYLQR